MDTRGRCRLSASPDSGLQFFLRSAPEFSSQSVGSSINKNTNKSDVPTPPLSDRPLKLHSTRIKYVTSQACSKCKSLFKSRSLLGEGVSGRDIFFSRLFFLDPYAVMHLIFACRSLIYSVSFRINYLAKGFSSQAHALLARHL